MQKYTNKLNHYFLELHSSQVPVEIEFECAIYHI